MKIIISPAKKMRSDTDSLLWRDYPIFLNYAEQLCSELRKMSAEELKRLWKCSDQILNLNVERLKTMDLYHGLTPALLAYEGIQYQYMAPTVFTDTEFEYVQEHLRILSGLYGVLRPFDGVTPYRLEMQSKFRIGGAKDLYEFWGAKISNSLACEADCVINLASKEYSLCVSKHLQSKVRFITCVFGEEINGKVIEKGTMCKMARGEMVRYMAENDIIDPQELMAFDRLHYRFSPKYSDDNTLVFVRDAKE